MWLGKTRGFGKAYELEKNEDIGCPSAFSVYELLGRELHDGDIIVRVNGFQHIGILYKHKLYEYNFSTLDPNNPASFTGNNRLYETQTMQDSYAYLVGHLEVSDAENITSNKEVLNTLSDITQRMHDIKGGDLVLYIIDFTPSSIQYGLSIGTKQVHDKVIRGRITDIFKVIDPTEDELALKKELEEGYRNKQICLEQKKKRETQVYDLFTNEKRQYICIDKTYDESKKKYVYKYYSVSPCLTRPQMMLYSNMTLGSVVSRLPKDALYVETLGEDYYYVIDIIKLNKGT